MKRDRVALNPIQWSNLPPAPGASSSEGTWRFGEPTFREEYPSVLAELAQSGFDATMMEVLDTQTLQSYQSMVRNAGLRLAPGYASIALPEDHDVRLRPGSSEYIRWFDPIRRKAEESNYFGLRSVFLAPEVDKNAPRWTERAAVGYLADADRLARVTEMIAEAARVLAAEGIRAGLHNHVGTWVETAEEIEFVLDAVDADLLGASFDIGHLAWAGIDPVEFTTRYADRIVDLHIKDLDLPRAAALRQHPAPYDVIGFDDFFREPGRGDIDLDGVLDALPSGFDGWIIIEVDQVHTEPLASAAQSWAWVETRLEP